MIRVVQNGALRPNALLLFSPSWHPPRIYEEPLMRLADVTRPERIRQPAVVNSSFPRFTRDPQETANHAHPSRPLLRRDGQMSVGDRNGRRPPGHIRGP